MEYLAERLAAVPRVAAVTLGGSRATGAAVEGSDWDFGLYYRGGLDPADITPRTLTRCPDSAAVPVSSSVN